MVPDRIWVVTYESRPWSINAERGWHYHKRAKLIDEWREAFALLARVKRIPACSAIHVIATPIFPDKRVQDIGNSYGAVKAGIDGLVDAGVIPDDTPDYLKALTFRVPRIERKRSALELIVIEVQ